MESTKAVAFHLCKRKITRQIRLKSQEDKKPKKNLKAHPRKRLENPEKNEKVNLVEN